MSTKNRLMLLLTVLPALSWSALFPNSSYWQCVTQDQTKRTWSASSGYQKTAYNLAIAACKKESTVPMSCMAHHTSCTAFNQSLNQRAQWRCTALDVNADPWISNYYANPDDAALAAKAFCQDNSTVPGSCYINMVTCTNDQG